jgi:hypothetical protein
VPDARQELAEGQILLLARIAEGVTSIRFALTVPLTFARCSV